MLNDLKDQGWTDREIHAYLSAQESHGALAPCRTTWEIKSAAASWSRLKPKRKNDTEKEEAIPQTKKQS